MFLCNKWGEFCKYMGKRKKTVVIANNTTINTRTHIVAALTPKGASFAKRKSHQRKQCSGTHMNALWFIYSAFHTAKQVARVATHSCRQLWNLLGVRICMKSFTILLLLCFITFIYLQKYEMCALSVYRCSCCLRWFFSRADKQNGNKYS